MHNDNVYPLSGQAFRPGWNEAKEKKAQTDEQVLEQLPVLKDVLEHLDGAIASTDSVKEALVISKQHEVSVENALIALNIANSVLAKERGFILSKIKNLK